MRNLQAIRFLVCSLGALLMLVAPTGVGARDGRIPPPPRCRYLSAGPPGVGGNVLLIDHSMNVRILREGTSIVVLAEGGITPLVVPCEGGTSNVRSIDRIVYSPIEGAHRITIDEGGGIFAPGASGERGGDEIEIEVNFPWTKKQRQSAVRVFGSSEDDQIRVGAFVSRRTGIDLDVAHGGRHKDVDLVVDAVSPFHLQLHGGDGADRLSSAGVGPEFIGPLPERSIVMRGGEGSDFLIGGQQRDLVDGEGDDDVIYGRGGPDRLSGGEGDDRVFGGAGDDALAAGADPMGTFFDFLSGGDGRDSLGAIDGNRDKLRCGAGRDQAYIDPVDEWSRATCEKQHGPGIPH